jgi:phosphopantetheinyl transferase (holo-ACP synthase)
MQFVGNDIVAYKHERCIGKWKDDRFLQKILLQSEIENLHLQFNKDAYLWALWTLKEAAYKLSCFLGNRNKFHPIQFGVHSITYLNDDMVQHTIFDKSNIAVALQPNVESIICFENVVFYGKSVITHEFIHSIVSNLNEFENLHYAIGQHSNFNKNDYSKEVRVFAMEELAKKNILIDTIYKDIDGIPFIIVNETEKYISLSHDQQFVSYAYV